jgi:dimethylglycine dehydrogenase
MEPVEAVTFARSNAHGPVGEECRAVRDAVGVMEIASFAKYEVSGPGAAEWLGRILAGRVPEAGRIALNPMLNPSGRLIGDFTLSAAAPQRFFLFGSGIAESYHLRWLEAHLPERGVALRPLTAELLGLQIAGPRSRELLARVTRAEVTNDAFPFLSFRPLDLGMIPCRVGRISFTGELGYEIWCRADYLLALHDLLLEAGKGLGLRHFGARALNSLRLEKGFGTWAREYRPIYGPFAAGLGRFLDLAKGDFIGREAALREKEQGPDRRLVTFVVDAADADVIGDEPVWHEGQVVGWVTSGGFGHVVERSLALGYIPTALAASTGFEIEILGDRRPARLQPQPLLDPQGLRMRG